MSMHDERRISRFEAAAKILHKGSNEDLAMQTALDLLHFAIKHEIDFRSIFEAAQALYLKEMEDDRAGD